MRVGWSSTLITGISTPPPSFRHLNLKMGKFWAPFTSNRSFESWAACGCIYQLCSCPMCISDRWETICKTERSSFSKSFPVAQLWANHQSRRPWATVFGFWSSGGGGSSVIFDQASVLSWYLSRAGGETHRTSAKQHKQHDQAAGEQLT